MHDYVIVLRALALIVWNFSPALAGFAVVAFYAHITHGEDKR